MLCGNITIKGKGCKNYLYNDKQCYHHYNLERNKKCCMFTKKGKVCNSYQTKQKNGFCKIHQKFKNLIKKDKKCSICLESNKKQLAFLNCKSKHFFHRECILNWLKENNTCPICREQIKINNKKNIDKIIHLLIDWAIEQEILSSSVDIIDLVIFNNNDEFNLFKIYLTLSTNENFIFIIDLN